MNISSSRKLGWIVATLVAMACGPQAEGGDGNTDDGMECVGVGPMMQLQLCVWPNN